MYSLKTLLLETTAVFFIDNPEKLYYCIIEVVQELERGSPCELEFG